MDILAHALWAGAGATLACRYLPITPAVVVSTVVLGLLPDVFHLLPIAGRWMFVDGSFHAVRAYAIAMPGQLPVLPEMVGIWSHHIVIDVFTHSADYYPSPLLYPIT